MFGPYQGRDLSNCGVGRLRVAINCGVLSVNSGNTNNYENDAVRVLTKTDKTKYYTFIKYRLFPK